MNLESILLMVIAIFVVCMVLYVLFRNKSQKESEEEFDYSRFEENNSSADDKMFQLKDYTEDFITSYGFDIFNYETESLNECDNENDEEYDAAYGIIDYREKDIKILKSEISGSYPIFNDLKFDLGIFDCNFPSFGTSKEAIEYTEDVDEKYNWVSYISPIKSIFNLKCESITYDFNDEDKLFALFITMAEDENETNNDNLFRKLALILYDRFGMPSFINVFKTKQPEDDEYFEEEIVFVLSWDSKETSININYNRVTDDPLASMIFINYLDNEMRFEMKNKEE